MAAIAMGRIAEMTLLDDMPIRYPWVRANLKGVLAGLRDSATQERIIRDGPSSEADDWFFDSVLNELPSQVAELESVALRDAEEVAAVTATRDALDSVAASLRLPVDDGAWVASPLWPEVVRCAALAYALLDGNDEVPPPPSRQEVEHVLDHLAAGDVSWGDAVNWVGQWLVWGRRDIPGPIWTALYRISGQGEARHQRSDKEAREDALRWRNELRQS